MPGFRAVVSFVVASYAGAALAQPADAGLFLSVADNIGTEINGFGPFTDEDLIRTNPAGAFAEAFFAIDAGDRATRSTSSTKCTCCRTLPSTVS